MKKHSDSQICAMMLLVGVFAVTMPGPADSQTTSDGTPAPRLSAASAFQFGPLPRLADAAMRTGLDDLRDGILWRQVEAVPGVYDFQGQATAPVRNLVTKGTIGSITVYPSNPLYDDGHTVHTDRGIKAFAAFVAALVRAFPQLGAIELANEFNSTSFVTGPAKEMTGLERADLYARYLQAFAAYPELKSIKIIGGAAHSLPGAFLQRITEQAPPDIMDAITVHPYTTDPEQLPSQIAVLRRIKGLESLEYEVTEFGTNKKAAAPDYFWKSYCAMAMAGVTRATWYPMEVRGDGYEPVFSRQGQLTALGQAFFLVRDTYAQKPFTVFQPDPFTYGCVFDDKLAVIWGAKRSVEIKRSGLRVANASLGVMDAAQGLTLDPDSVLLIQAQDGDRIDPWEDIALGTNGLVADSFDQFILPKPREDATTTAGYGFSRFLKVGGRELGLSTCGGQDNANAPWTPYLCSDVIQRFVLGPKMFVLGGNSENPVNMIHRFTASAEATLRLEVDLTVAKATKDGVEVTVLLDGNTVGNAVVTGIERLDFDGLAMKMGSVLDISVSPGGNPAGDAGQIRIRLLDHGAPISPAQN